MQAAPKQKDFAVLATSPRHSPRRRIQPWLAALLIIAALLPSGYLCWRAREGFQLGILFEDDEFYLSAAKSMVEKGEYKIPSLPGQPYQTKYPPVYPLLLAGIWKLNPAFPANLEWFVLLSWCLWVCFLAVSFVAFRQLPLTPIARFTGLILLASNAACQFLAIQLMPEALFATFIIAAILLAEHVPQSSHPALVAIGAAAATGCACLTKTAAIPLAITIPLVFIFRRQYRWAVYFTVVVAPFVAGWLVWSAMHRAHVSDPVLTYYVDYLGFYRLNVHWTDLPALLWYNLQYFKGMFSFVLPSLSHADVPPSLVQSVTLLPVALSLIGIVRLLKKARFLHASAFCAAYLVELLMWNFNPSGRFLYPLIPFFVAGFVYEVTYGTNLVYQSLPARAQTLRIYGAGAISAAIVALSFFASAVHARETVRNDIVNYRETKSSLIQAYTWIDQHLPKDASFAAYDGAGLYLYTGHHALRNQIMTRPYIMDDIDGIEAPITGIADFARRNRLNYVLWNAPDYGMESEPSRDRLLARNKGMGVVYDSRSVRIYQVY